MKNTDILSRITALLNKKVSLAQMTLDNGTVVESDSFAVGDPIFAIDGENKVPLEVGKYTMEDGTVLEVFEIGIVGEVAPAEAKEEAKSEEEMAAELAAVTEVARLAEEEKTNDVILKVVEALKPIFDELNSKIENLSKVSNEVKETLSKVTEKKPLVHKPIEAKLNSVQNIGANLSGTEARVMAMLSK